MLISFNFPCEGISDSQFANKETEAWGNYRTCIWWCSDSLGALLQSVPGLPCPPTDGVWGLEEAPWGREGCHGVQLISWVVRYELIRVLPQDIPWSSSVGADTACRCLNMILGALWVIPWISVGLPNAHRHFCTQRKFASATVSWITVPKNWKTVWNQANYSLQRETGVLFMANIQIRNIIFL